MIYDPWRGKLLGFVYVYGSYIWIYVSRRKWRSYDYCVNCDNVERFVSLTLTHDLLWIVYDYANDVVLIERLFSWKHYECNMKGFLTWVWYLRLRGSSDFIESMIHDISCIEWRVKYPFTYVKTIYTIYV